MGSSVAQVGPSTQPQGKGNGPLFADILKSTTQPVQQPTVQPVQQPAQQPMPQGKGSRVTYPGQGGQPRMGVPNNYSNTVGQWDNASIQPAQTQSGKGKGV